MQLTVQRDLLDQFAAICFKGGAEVVDVHATQLRHQPIRDARWNAAHDEVIDALLAPSADDVVSLFQLLQKQRDVVGIVLQVAIHGDDVLTASIVEAGRQSRCLPEVAAQLDDDHAAVYSSDLVQVKEGLVAAAVVYKDQLEAFAGRLHHVLEAVVELGDVLFLVVKRHNDREPQRRNGLLRSHGNRAQLYLRNRQTFPTQYPRKHAKGGREKFFVIMGFARPRSTNG